MDPGPSDTRARRSNLFAWIVGIAALAALIAGIVHFGDARHFVELAKKAQPGWLLLALVLQVGTYATEAGVWRLVLTRARSPRPFRELYALAVVALFTNQAVPTAGVAGTLVAVRALEQRGVRREAAMSAMLVDLVGFYVGFASAAAFALLVLSAHHDLSPLLWAMAGTIVAVGLTIAGGALWLTAPGKPRTTPTWLRRWKPLREAVDAVMEADRDLLHSPSLLACAAVLRTCNFALDGLTLWACLAAVGHAPPAADAVAAYTVGALARTLGVIPGGLGTFEGGTIGGLALFGVPVEPGLAATLLFRGLSFWLPMLPGLWLGGRLAGKDTG